jgi:hypothetical protein
MLTGRKATKLTNSTPSPSFEVPLGDIAVAQEAGESLTQPPPIAQTLIVSTCYPHPESCISSASEEGTLSPLTLS